MQRSLDTAGSNCPYCGEPIELLVDCSIPMQQYIEDCEVCCRPIMISVTIDQDGQSSLSLRSEDDPTGA